MQYRRSIVRYVLQVTLHIMDMSCPGLLFIPVPAVWEAADGQQIQAPTAAGEEGEVEIPGPGPQADDGLPDELAVR